MRVPGRRIGLVIALLLLAAPRGAAASAEEGVTIELVARDLEMPVDLAFGPDGAMYYVELMSGNLRVLRPGADAPDPEPLWSAPDLQTGGERGLLGLALDPEFATTRAFYVFYTHNRSGEVVNRVSRIVDGSETVVLDGLRAGLLHNSGRIAFLPDRTMLVSLGDATLDTVGRHKAAHAHDPHDLSGKILRLARDGSPAPDNPWGNAVWSKGHRNVYGLAVSPEGVVLATENGPDRGDEVNLIEPGRDYGWPTCVGPCDPSDARFADPVLSYARTIAPTGATWHRGAFYFGDFNPARVHRVHPLPNGTWADDKVASFGGSRVLDVEAGADGLYVATWDSIHRLRLDARWDVAPPPDGPSSQTPGGKTPGTPDGSTGGGLGVGPSGDERGTPLPGVAALALALGGAAAARARLRRGRG